MMTSVNSFVGDLVEMAKAYEALPQLEAERDRLIAQSQRDGQTIADREQRIIELKAQLEEAQAKTREVEKQRDEASFRLLEVEDTFNKVFSSVGSALASANELQKVLHPPQPEPVQVQAPIQQDPFSGQGGGLSQPLNVEQGAQSGQSEPRPTTQTDAGAQTDQSSGAAIASVASAEAASSSGSTTNAGQSDPNPTVNSTDGSQSGSVSSEAAASKGGASPDDWPSYANEPATKYSYDWYRWSDAMDRRYGVGFWPNRQAAQ